MAAFAFLNFILLLVLNIFLLSLAIVQANRGNSAIWTSCVTDVDYGAPAASSASTEAKIGYDSPGVPVTPLAQYPQPVPTPQQQYSQTALLPQQMYPPQQVYTPQPQQPGMPMAAQV